MGIAIAERAVEPEVTAEVSWELLLRAWQELDIPGGWRAEIRGEDIVVVPPPSNAHGLVASKVHWTLKKIAPEGVEAIQNVGVRIPALSKLYIPDLVFIAESDVSLDQPGLASANLLLVVEITSRGDAEDDRGDKRMAYAKGEVPLYLLIDAWDRSGPTVTLFSEPRNGDYDGAQRVPFGKPIAIPEPFGAELETADFPVHPGVPKHT
ncbi:Uma2 family endonuclease [Spinactinospora alkalitolerans]|uniref:Uma2 family endonuclease n=1 Tax=Spinactinospora alkalitolerans TaxID=687207 RepID=A0A852U0Y6_9ACTN|nr:Uma2 family endonuclease [Spinactinospora alkalitolerans]NYE49781.1 Uma2 family endonuclease [Spinactinospora alkalitolerans]